MKKHILAFFGKMLVLSGFSGVLLLAGLYGCRCMTVLEALPWLLAALEAATFGARLTCRYEQE